MNALTALRPLEDRAVWLQLDQEGVPPTTIREVSLLKVLGRSNHVVKCASTPSVHCNDV